MRMLGMCRYMGFYASVPEYLGLILDLSISIPIQVTQHNKVHSRLVHIFEVGSDIALPPTTALANIFPSYQTNFGFVENAGESLAFCK